jgi:hypothetical protein
MTFAMDSDVWTSQSHFSKHRDRRVQKVVKVEAQAYLWDLESERLPGILDGRFDPFQFQKSLPLMQAGVELTDVDSNFAGWATFVHKGDVTSNNPYTNDPQQSSGVATKSLLQALPLSFPPGAGGGDGGT